MSDIIKGFKGFHKGMICSGVGYAGEIYSKEYKEDTTFEIDGDLEICHNGMHFCKHPMDVFDYYPPCDGNELNVYAEVEAFGDVIGDDNKTCTNKLHIKKELSLSEYIDVCVKYIVDNCDDTLKETNTGTRSASTNTGDCSASTNTGHSSASSNTGFCSVATNTGFCSAATNTGDWSASTNTGDWSASTNTGNYSAATNTGDCSVSTNTGTRSASTNTGNYSAATNTGYRSVATNTGDWSASTNTGNYSAATNTGYRSVSTNTGNYSASEVSGEHSVAVCTGIDGKAKGALGCGILLYEYTDSGEFVDMHFAKVDGVIIKADTFYTIKDGKFVECGHHISKGE